MKLNTTQYGEILGLCYQKRQPLFVSGGPGIGKSTIPRLVFKDVAKQEGRKFVEWADMGLDQKSECINNPEKYWVFADMRTSQMDTTSLVGIPNMAKTDQLENIPYSWVVYFTQTQAGGCIFFDEINLAAPIVQSITYSAIHDRVISDRRLGEKVYVFAAGNRAQDKAHTFDMPLPLRDRFAEFEVEIDFDGWMNWACGNGINPHLVAFINWKPSALYNVEKCKGDKVSTPRGIERASRLIGNKDVSEKNVHTLVAISCGEGVATEFEAYCKVFKKLDWEKIYADPESIKGMAIDQQHAICGGLTEKFNKSTKLDEQATIFKVASFLPEDFAVYCYKMIKMNDGEKFKNAMIKSKFSQEFTKRYAKFLVD